MRKSKTEPKINSEIREKPCKQCGRPTTNDKTCSGCEKIICDRCSKFIEHRRYCPRCFEKVKTLSKLA